MRSQEFYDRMSTKKEWMITLKEDESVRAFKKEFKEEMKKRGKDVKMSKTDIQSKRWKSCGGLNKSSITKSFSFTILN